MYLIRGRSRKPEPLAIPTPAQLYPAEAQHLKSLRRVARGTPLFERARQAITLPLGIALGVSHLIAAMGFLREFHYVRRQNSSDQDGFSQRDSF